VQLRAAVDADEPFLTALLASTRPVEVAAMPSPAAAEQLFAIQRRAQRAAWLSVPGTSERVLLIGGAPAGHLVVRDEPAALRLVDISLLPEHRGQGIGTRLIESLQTRAAQADAPLLLHVDVGSPAERLYARLGFVAEASDQVRTAMRWIS
jgi:GNAT superfamily N-acetyltransferase